MATLTKLSFLMATLTKPSFLMATLTKLEFGSGRFSLSLYLAVWCPAYQYQALTDGRCCC